MQDVFIIFRRALVFLFKPGNLAYWPLPVLFSLLFLLLPFALPPILLISAALVSGAVSACKLLDSATRIMNGLDDEPVPLAPLTVLPPPVAFIVLGGVVLCGLVFGLIGRILGIGGNMLQFVSALVLAFLLPLWLMAVLESHRFASLFAPDEWVAALQRIGTERYVLAVGLPMVLAAVLLVVCGLLPGYVGIAAESLAVALGGALSAVAWAYFVGREEADDTDFGDMDLDNMDFSDIVMDESLLAAMAEGRADDIPEGEFVTVRAEPAVQAGKAEKGGLMSRLRGKGKAAGEAVTEAPQPRKTVLPDMSLLAEADVQHLDFEDQIVFVRDLMDADGLWQGGDLAAAESILLRYAGAEARIAAYFPAFKRLDRIYRQQGREDERRELHGRMLAAAAQEGCKPAYHLAHAQVQQYDAAALPADWIAPLAQYAAAEGHYDNVLHLTKNFARNHPGHAHIVDNYFLAARALEKLGNLTTAQQLLAQLLQRYPDHPRIGQIRATHGLLGEKIRESQN